MYIVELLILADKYEDKGFDTNSFITKIKRLTQYNFYINTNIKTNYYGKLTGYSRFGNGYGYGYDNGYGLGFGYGYGDGFGFGNSYGFGIGDF